MTKKSNLRLLALSLVTSVMLLGCKVVNDRVVNMQVDEQVYQDDLFIKDASQEIDILTEEEIFALDDTIRDELNSIARYNDGPSNKAVAIVEHIFKRSNEDMLYNSHANLTARDAYHTRKANCLSLAILAYSMSDYFNLNVGFQQVQIPEYWTHRRGMSLLNNHVNLRVFAKDKRENGMLYMMWGDIVIDFDPFSPKKKFPSKLITKQHILAMFYNNLGATAFVENNHAVAYQYFKKATQTDPSFAGAWNNLGFLYRSNDQYDLAKMSYDNALFIDSEDLNTLNNVAVLHEYQGEMEKAKQIHAYIEQKRLQNPYYHRIQGDEAYSRGELEQAITHYKDALAIDSSEHEFYFGLAKSYYALGEEEQSRRALIKAKKHATQWFDRDKYESKLSVLNTP